MRNDLYRQFLMPSHEVYYDLSVCYELSRLVDIMQIVTNASMVTYSFFWGIYLHILARMCIFWLIFRAIFKRWSSNVHLWCISITNNNSSQLRLLRWPSLICRTFSDLVKTQCFLLLAFKFSNIVLKRCRTGKGVFFKFTQYKVHICSTGERGLILKGCVRYIFASLFFKSKGEHLGNKQKCFLFHFKSSFCSPENQTLEF